MKNNINDLLSNVCRQNKEKFLIYLLTLEKQEMLNNQEPVSAFLRKGD